MKERKKIDKADDVPPVTAVGSLRADKVWTKEGYFWRVLSKTSGTSVRAIQPRDAAVFLYMACRKIGLRLPERGSAKRTNTWNWEVDLSATIAFESGACSLSLLAWALCHLRGKTRSFSAKLKPLLATVTPPSSPPAASRAALDLHWHSWEQDQVSRFVECGSGKFSFLKRTRFGQSRVWTVFSFSSSSSPPPFLFFNYFS